MRLSLVVDKRQGKAEFDEDAILNLLARNFPEESASDLKGVETVFEIVG